ncbi:MAG: PIN domain-containing protein [Candidatus Aenigmatarchaeota archaeon]
MKIAIDTNIFIYSVRFKLDIFSQLKGNEIFTTEAAMRELEKLAKGDSRDAKAAALALSMLKEKISSEKIAVLKQKTENADDGLFELGKNGYIVITQDRDLLKRLKSAGCAFGYIKQRKYFAFEGI